MRRSRNAIAVAAASCVFAATQATAEQRWTGAYVGANAGYSWGEADYSTTFPCVFPANCTLTNPANIAAVEAGSSGSINVDGATLGIQAGLNHQIGPAVLGIEFDFGGSHLNGFRSQSGLMPAVAGQFTSSAYVNSDWMMGVRGRLGWAAKPDLLIYATGGLAVADVELKTAYSDTVAPPASGSGSRSSTKVGYSIGAGAEWAFSSRWSLKGEYLYSDLGSITNTTSVVAPGFLPQELTTKMDLEPHTARVGLNYRF